MLTSRLFFMAPVIFAVASTQAANVTYTSQVWSNQASVTFDGTTDGPVTNTSLPSTTVEEYQNNLDLLTLPTPIVSIENKSVAPYTPNDPVAPAVSYLATVQVFAVGTAGLPQSAFGSASIDLDFTVSADTQMLYTFAVTDFTPSPFFITTGSFSLTGTGAGFTPLAGNVGDAQVDQLLLFPAGDYHMSITIRSDLVGPLPDDLPALSLSGLSFGIQEVPVPEPTTIALIAIGILMLARRNHRRHA